MFYAELLKQFENVKNLGGKSWQHSMNLDVTKDIDIKDCSIHCFHYQQMFEMLFKHTLEIKSEFGAYPHTHKLERLLEAIISMTKFKIDKGQYLDTLKYITACAEIYRYNFQIDCKSYKESIETCDKLLIELVNFLKGD